MNIELILTGILCLIIFGCGFWVGEVRGMCNGRIWWEDVVLTQRETIAQKDKTIQIQSETIKILRDGLDESSEWISRIESKLPIIGRIE